MPCPNISAANDATLEGCLVKIEMDVSQVPWGLKNYTYGCATEKGDVSQ